MTTQASRDAGATTSESKTASAGKDAIELLTADHREVEAMFKTYEGLKDDQEDQKSQLADKICAALKVHTQIEEEIFYPAAKEALKEPDMVEEAIVEHAGAKTLINEIEQMEPSEELYDAKVKVLSEQIDHHVGEEETELFPACRKTDMDMEALGEQMQRRKTELMRQMADGQPKAH